MTESKKVLITGANGLLGANTARLLYRRGYEPRLMIRPKSDIRSVSDLPCEIFRGDIADSGDALRAAEGCRYVVHTASVTGQWGIPYNEYERINITGTRNIVEACLARGVEKLVHVSTANTIGPGTRERPGTELNGFALHHIGSGYINSKYVAQQYVLEQSESRGLPAVIVNPTFMIGPYDAKPSSGRIILYGKGKKILFHPPGGKNFVDVRDVSAGILRALESGRTGDCYLLAGENLSYREFFALLARIEGRECLLIRIPPLLLKALGLAGEVLGRMTGRSMKLNYASARLLCMDNYYSGRKSERELQLRYTPVDEAVRSALEWFDEKDQSPV